jgi:hypothetical protein
MRQRQSFRFDAKSVSRQNEDFDKCARVKRRFKKRENEMAIETQEIVKTANDASAAATAGEAAASNVVEEPKKATTERKYFALPVAPESFHGVSDIQAKLDEMMAKAKALAVLTPIEAAASTFVLQPQLYDLCATGIKNASLALPGVKRNDANTGWQVTIETVSEVNRRFLYHLYEKLQARSEDFDEMQAAKLTGNGHKTGVVSTAYIAKKAEELTDEEFDAIVAARAAKKAAAKIVDAVLAEVDAK